MRLLLACLFAAGLAGCTTTAVVVAGSAAWVATEYVYDTQPLEYVAEFFDKSCGKYTIYDQPQRCRR
ncbi:MAG: hypothetical protein O3B74_07665 [Proteobacteria bacterium]|nr:hypothetical protein [Pseudomonadota bacterium]